jgi:hypothetical protein
MQIGAGLLNTRRECEKRTLDISGDGKSNLGPRPQDARIELQGDDLTINGLVIGSVGGTYNAEREETLAELSAYYNAYVIMGEDAFVETALNFDDYANAMARKLKRELDLVIVSSLAPDRHANGQGRRSEDQ